MLPSSILMFMSENEDIIFILQEPVVIGLKVYWNSNFNGIGYNFVDTKFVVIFFATGEIISLFSILYCQQLILK